MRSITYVIGTLIACIIFVLGMLLFAIENGVYDITAVNKTTQGSPTIVYDDEGVEIARFQKDIRSHATITHIPDHVIHAFLAAEDHTFFTHTGISLPSIIRSFVKNLYYRKIVQGASTITQQLVKMVYCGGERSFSRKLKEQLLALFIERRFTKEQILQAYLNNIYLGCGIYGVQAASIRFWNKDVEELTVDEAASIAAVVQSPAHYCPLRSQDNNQTRRNLILSRMVNLGYISEGTYHHAIGTSVTLSPYEQTTSHFPHVTEYLRARLEATLGHRALYHGGYTVKTTLNTSMQTHAEEVFRHHIAEYRHNVEDIDGGLITIDTQYGGIKTMVGGYAFTESQFNRAIQARRQMGSIFKPFVYAAAVDQGTRLSDTAVDEPITIGEDWSPRNVHRRHEGTMTYARALTHSNNIITVKLFLDTGAEHVINHAQQCHLPGPFAPYPSLALGCTECTVADAASAFNVFANQGVYVAPHLIEWIKDKHGTKTWTHKPLYEQALSWETCSQVTHVLKLTMENLKPRMPHLWIDEEAIGKTGTTNSARTCWFVGSTPSYTTALYLGCDDNEELAGSITSVYHALPIWLACHRQWYAETPETFYIDPRLRLRHVHARTGDTVSADHPRALAVYEPAHAGYRLQ